MATETITVMFTDLVGSTALSAELRADRAELLRREHFALLRAVVADAGGREVKNMGDGLMVVFRSSTTALDAPVGIQQQIEARNRRAADVLLIRVGVSLGEADSEDGDYFGSPVVEASRLCAAAAGGQVLTTEIVRALTGARRGHRFEPVGDLELKGFDAPIAAWSVAWEPLVAKGVGVCSCRRLEWPPGQVFVGRGPELAVLSDAVKAAASERRRRLVLIGGEPGIGKTTLAIDAVQQGHEAGATVLYGRSDEDVGVPYQAWIEVLAHLVAHAPDALLDAHVAEYGGELVRLVPGLARRKPDLPTPRVSDPETERYLLFGAVDGLLREAAAEWPVIVVLDDLHWADKPTLVLLWHLLGAPAPAALVLIGTFRESELGADHPWVDTLAALHREHNVARLSLRGLEDVELIELMKQVRGMRWTPTGSRSRTRCDGRPTATRSLSPRCCCTSPSRVRSSNTRDAGSPVTTSVGLDCR
jgi:class 3 adenylate cyclase